MLKMIVRNFATALPLTLLLTPLAFAQVQPGQSPLSGSKGGTDNAFMQFSGPASSVKTFTLPNQTDTIATLGAIQTFTAAKTFASDKLLLGGSSSGVGTLNAPAAAAAYIWTLPALTDTLVSKTSTDTLTNKTLTAPALTDSILATAITAPSTPAAGKVLVFVDSTDKRLHDKNDAGAIGTTVVADTGASNNFLTAISAAGAISKAQPAFSNLSGSVAATQMPALTGDITTSAGAVATTLATVNSNVGAFGSSTSIPTFTVNGKGLITAASGNAVIAPAGTLTGGTLANNVLASSLTSVGTLTGGATGAGFTVALTVSTVTGNLPCANRSALTGDVTTSSGSCATTLTNIPTAVPMAGSLLATAIAAPSTPAAGKGSIYVDSTSKNIVVKDDAGVVKHGVQTKTATSNQFVTAISDAGVVSQAQPAFSDLSGTAAAAQIAGSAASHAVPIDVAGTPTWKVIPDCTDAAGNHLNYTQSTDVFSCGTSGAGGGSIGTDDSLNIMLNSMANARSLSLAQFMGLRFADSFGATTYVNTGAATNLDSGTAGLLKPTVSVPTLIARTDGSISNSGAFNTNISAAFDGTTSQGSAASTSSSGASTSGYNNTIGKDWGVGVTHTVTKYIYYGPNDTNVLGGGGGTTVKLQGSNDNSAWTDLTSGDTIASGSSNVTTVTSGINTSTAYRYHRLNFSGNGVNSVFVAEIQFYEGVSAANNMTVQSTSIAVPVVPSACVVYARTKHVDSATIGTDYNFYMSRDGGTTFSSAASMTDYFTDSTDSAHVSYSASVDVSGQPSGSNVQLKFITANNKNVELRDWGFRCS